VRACVRALATCYFQSKTSLCYLDPLGLAGFDHLSCLLKND
jgi:hypothetical protein